MGCCQPAAALRGLVFAEIVGVKPPVGDGNDKTI